MSSTESRRGPDPGATGRCPRPAGQDRRLPPQPNRDPPNTPHSTKAGATARQTNRTTTLATGQADQAAPVGRAPAGARWPRAGSGVPAGTGLVSRYATRRPSAEGSPRAGEPGPASAGCTRAPPGAAGLELLADGSAETGRTAPDSPTARRTPDAGRRKVASGQAAAWRTRCRTVPCRPSAAHRGPCRGRSSAGTG